MLVLSINMKLKSLNCSKYKKGRFKMSKEVEYSATGKRKTSIAQVRLALGKGKIEINGKDLKDYFVVERMQVNIMQPLVIIDGVKKYDVMASVKGGGLAGQSEALRHGIARALVDYDASLRKILKKSGFLRRDSREKERKKYGHRKARASYQFSKR